MSCCNFDYIFTYTHSSYMLYCNFIFITIRYNSDASCCPSTSAPHVYTQASTYAPIECTNDPHEYPLKEYVAMYLLVSSVPCASDFALLKIQRQFSRKLSSLVVELVNINWHLVNSYVHVCTAVCVHMMCSHVR